MREIKCKTMAEWLEKLTDNVLEETVKPIVQAEKLRFGFTVSKHKNKIGYFVDIFAFKKHVDIMRKQKAIMKCFGKKANATENRIERVVEHLRDKN